MTPEEKVALLKDAGVWDVIGFPTCIDKLFELVAAHEREKLKNVAIFSRWHEELDKAIAAEREACAKVCDEIFSKCVDDFEAGAADECAAAIRARTEKTE